MQFDKYEVILSLHIVFWAELTSCGILVYCQRKAFCFILCHITPSPVCFLVEVLTLLVFTTLSTELESLLLFPFIWFAPLPPCSCQFKFSWLNTRLNYLPPVNKDWWSYQLPLYKFAQWTQKRSLCPGSRLQYYTPTIDPSGFTTRWRSTAHSEFCLKLVSVDRPGPFSHIANVCVCVFMSLQSSFPPLLRAAWGSSSF